MSRTGTIALSKKLVNEAITIFEVKLKEKIEMTIPKVQNDFNELANKYCYNFTHDPQKRKFSFELGKRKKLYYGTKLIT